MNFQTLLAEQLKAAMKAKDKQRLKTVRDLKSRVKLREIEKGDTLTEAEFIKLVQTAAKQRKEAIELYKKGKRPDLAAEEQAELAILEQYLPQMMAEPEMESLAAAIIKETGASGIQDMGKVMGALMKAAAGKADGKRLQEIVRRVLS